MSHLTSWLNPPRLAQMSLAHPSLDQDGGDPADDYFHGMSMKEDIWIFDLMNTIH